MDLQEGTEQMGFFFFVKQYTVCISSHILESSWLQLSGKKCK